MKTYSVRNKSQKKLFTVVLTVLVSVIVISSLTIVLGLYLKNKADGVEIGLSSVIGRDDINNNLDSDTDLNSIEKKPSPDKKAVYFNLKKINKENFNAQDEINIIKEAGFTAISISLVDKDGFMTYSSDSVSGFVKQHIADFVVQQDKLSDFIALAKENSIYTIAYYNPGNIISSDQTEGFYLKTLSEMIVSDVNKINFDEILISGIVPADDIDREKAEYIGNYLDALSKKLDNVKISLSFFKDTLKKSTLSPQIEYLSSFVDYIALDLTSDNINNNSGWEDFLKSLKEEMAGYINIYNMRFILAAEEENLYNEISEAVNKVEYLNFQFVINPDFKNIDEPKPGDESDNNNSSNNTDTNNAGDDVPVPTPDPIVPEPDVPAGTSAVPQDSLPVDTPTSADNDSSSSNSDNNPDDSSENTSNEDNKDPDAQDNVDRNDPDRNNSFND